MAGDYSNFDGAHPNKSESAHFGKPKGTLKPTPDSFRKKGTGTMVLPEPSKFNYQSQERKPPVVKKDEAPIHGLKTDKNFIVSNAVEVILKPAKKEIEDKDPLKKKNYGRVPDYLQKVKADIEEEYSTLRQLKQEQQDEEEKKKYLMTPEEISELKEGLKKKWETVNKEYQMITHIRKPDTQGLKRKKENCEKELAQIEKDMELLDKAFVFVDTTA
jgi:Calmodulin-binding